jgi:hypothetical protein
MRPSNLDSQVRRGESPDPFTPHTGYADHSCSPRQGLADALARSDLRSLFLRVDAVGRAWPRDTTRRPSWSSASPRSGGEGAVHEQNRVASASCLGFQAAAGHGSRCIDIDSGERATWPEPAGGRSRQSTRGGGVARRIGASSSTLTSSTSSIGDSWRTRSPTAVAASRGRSQSSIDSPGHEHRVFVEPCRSDESVVRHGGEALLTSPVRDACASAGSGGPVGDCRSPR